jgi:N-acetylmuramoyl-L-alanine amidase
MSYTIRVKYYLATILALMLFGVPAVSSRFGEQVDYVAQLFSRATDQLAAVIISHNPKTVTDIQSRYNSSRSSAVTVEKGVRILIVPGHEPGYGGAEFGSLKERDMALELSHDLIDFLRNNDHYHTYITRDGTGWMSEFADYFKNDWQGIKEWEAASVQDMAHRITVGGSSVTVPTVFHNSAPQDVAFRLYGITKWANENDIDITIHVHFNDAPDHRGSEAGSHTGFAIYIPEHQYANSTTSKTIAETVFKRLSKYNPVSDLKGEDEGIVEDPDLIAIGAHDTANAASMLIEYGYIYEPQFTNANTRSLALKDLAYQTFLGLEDFFDAKNSIGLARAYDTVALPHEWKRVLSAKDLQGPDIFALQTALLLDGDYPPAPKDLSDCPRTGKLGTCTKTALEAFQKKYNISGEPDVIGTKTLEFLNKNFGVGAI